MTSPELSTSLRFSWRQRSLELNYLPIRELYALGVPGLYEAVPEVPSIYIWTLDVTNASGPSDIRDALARFNNSGKTYSGRIGPYTVAQIREVLDPPTDAVIDSLASPLDPTEFRWATECATVLQRPLYVGKAVNLRRRTRQHLDPQSDLRSSLRDSGIHPRECAIVYVACPALIGDEIDDTDEESWESGESSGPDVLRLAEGLVISLSRPSFNRIR